MASYNWANGGFVDAFLTLYGFTYSELMLFYGKGMEIKDNMWYCFREVKCKQGFTTEI